jgi:hypothetical protein
MRNRILLGMAAAVAVGLLVPRSAHACGKGGYGGVYAAAIITTLAVVSVDGVLTLWDGGSALLSHHPSRGYGIFELIFTAPQFALSTYGMFDALSRHGDATPFAALTLWTGVLTTHAIWTLATHERPPQAVSLGPTFVPVGQQSKPGFGLVGRF